MAQTVFHFLFLKVCNRKLRYIIIGPSQELNVSSPLFLGIDLLHKTGIAKNNYCRIHCRYAKKGLATKIMFPNVVSMGGINNSQSGAWFYTLQGVFQLIFEYQSRIIQLKIAGLLFELWKSDYASPTIPETLNVTLEQLQSGRNSLLLSQLFDSRVVSSQPEQQQQVEATLSNVEGDGNVGTEEDSSDVASLPCVVDSLWCLSGDMIRRVEAYASRCSVDECHLVVGLVSTLKLVRAESRTSTKDGTFSSLLELISSYVSITSDATTLKRFGSATWCVDAKQDALLCLVGEWFGKYMNLFNKPITEKVDRFKLEHLGSFHDLPSSETLLDELFPECMRLLVGHWSGLYKSVMASDMSSVASAIDDVQIAHKVKLGGREDHSYSTQKDDPTTTESGMGRNVCQPFTSNNNNRVDHSYSSSSPTAPPVSETPQQTGGRRDHTYVAQQEVEELSPGSSLPTTREDHTYVSTKDKRTKVSGSIAVDTGQVLNPSKRLKMQSNVTIWNADSHKVVVDTAKYSVVELTLEFLNNVLISGVAHVVYTRLLRS